MSREESPRSTAATGLLVLAAAMGIGRFAFTPLLPMMQAEGLLSVRAGGALASVHFLGYLMGALAAAKLPGAARMVLGGSLLAIAVSTAGMGLTHNMAAWLVFRFAAGVCSAFALVAVSMHLVRRVADMGRTDVQGWVFSGVGAGTALVGVAVLGMMVSHTPSSYGWVLFGAASFGVAVLAFVRERPVEEHPARASTRPAVRTPLSWPAVFAYGCMGAGYIVPATFLPVMARDLIPDPLVFGWGWPVFGAAAFLSTILAARLYSVFTNLRIWEASQLIMALGLVLPALYPHIVVVVLGALCVGGTFMIITMSGIKHAHSIAPEDAQRHIAALTAAFATGQVAAPVLAGWAYDLSGSFSVPLILTGIALAATVPGLKREYCKVA